MTARPLFASIFALALALAACAGEPPDDRTAEPMEDPLDPGEAPGLEEIELCDAQEYRGLIGTGIAALTLPADPMIRAFGENDIVTQDYLPHRTNIVYREQGGEIFRVYCG